MQQFLVFVSEFPRSIGIVPLYEQGQPATGTGSSEEGRKFLAVSIATTTSNKLLVNIESLDIYNRLEAFERLDIDPVFGIAGIVEDDDEVYMVLISKVIQVRDSLHEICKVQKTRLLSLRTGEFDYTDEDMSFDQYQLQNQKQAQDLDLDLDSGMEYKSAFTPVPDNSYLGPYSIYPLKKKRSFSQLSNHRTTKIIGYLEKANLYFSQVYDLTTPAQEQQRQKQHRSKDSASFTGISQDRASEQSKLEYLSLFKRNKFRWNNFMLESFNQFERRLHVATELAHFRKRNYIVNLIQGYVGCLSRTPAFGTRDMLIFMVISRLSASRIGTRFLTRGIDDRGNVANSAQTEVVVFSNNWTFSYVQVRGSIPLFWTQQGLQLGAHKARLTRSIDASLPAAKKHFEEIITQFGTVHIVNLVKGMRYDGYIPTKSFLDAINAGNSFGELELGVAFDSLVKNLNLPELIGFTAFDYHQEVKGGQFDNITSLIDVLVPVMLRQKFFFKRFNIDGSNEIVESWQYGVFRTNCLDCLDRTNIVQSEIARNIVGLVLLERLSIELQVSGAEVDGILRRLLVESGNALSVLYAGTSALKTGVTATGRSGLSGFLSDASKTIGRFVQNNFNDKNKQAMIDTMVGNKQNPAMNKRFFYFDPDFPSFKQRLDTLTRRNTVTKKIKIFTSSFNAGGQMYNGQSLGSWLGPAISQESDVVLLAIQEVVNLNVASMINADTTNKTVWIKAVLRFLNENRNSAFGSGGSVGEYVLVASEQLVGICSILIVDSSILGLISNVGFTKIKTGIAGGLSGNKGAICLKFSLGAKVGVCFVAAHLSSGTNKVGDRAYDYNTINSSIPMSEADDITIWAGDLNYRLDLPLVQDVEELLASGNVRSLMLYDQLTSQINSGVVFQGGFFELPIQFRPTYKFHVGTSKYDSSSDPPRIPSYTDRILYKIGSKINGFKASEYFSCEDIISSDHKPVACLSELSVQVDILETEFPNAHINSKLASYDMLQLVKR